MPIYEYECSNCNRVEEALQKFSDKPLTRCKHCSGKLHRLVSHTSFRLKGTGWYVTDYADKSRPSSSSDATGNKKETAAAATTGNTDSVTKPATKSTTE